LVLGKEVRLEKDVSETDKYGCLLRYVYIGNDFINEELVKGGSAKVEPVPPDVKFKKEFLESEKNAKALNLGLWGNCFK
jgi:micrococcal nuclease